MISLFVFTVAVFGVSFCLGQSKISYPFRVRLSPGNKIESPVALARSWVLTLIECNACCSFWIAAASVYLGVAPHVFGVGVQGGALCAFYCCATSLILAKISGLDE